MGENLGRRQTEFACHMHARGVDRETALQAATFLVRFSIAVRELSQGKGSLLQTSSGAMGIASSTSSMASTSQSTPGKKGLIQGASLLSSEIGSDLSAANFLAKSVNITPSRAAVVALSMLMEKTMAAAEIATSEEQHACSVALAKVMTDGVVTIATSETIVGALLPAAAFALDAYDAKLKCFPDPR